MRAVNALDSPKVTAAPKQRPRSRALLDYLPAVVAAFGLMLLAALADRLNHDSDQQHVRADVADQIGVVRARLESVITTNAQLARGLAGIIAIEPDIPQDKFE